MHLFKLPKTHFGLFILATYGSCMQAGMTGEKSFTLQHFFSGHYLLSYKFFNKRWGKSSCSFGIDRCKILPDAFLGKGNVSGSLSYNQLNFYPWLKFINP